MTKIYGADPSKSITPHKVRDAIIKCFKQAHGAETQNTLGEMAGDFGQEGLNKLTNANVESIVQKAFRETGGDFINPDKKSIIAAMDWLAEFSKSFRTPDVIEKHYNEIMQLVKKLK